MLRPLALLSAIAALVLLVVPASAMAAPGDLDPSFGSAGVTSLASGTELFGVAVQSDGAVVAVGDTGGSSVLVQRFSASGAPQTPFAAGAGVGRGVAIQSDGKIVVAGYDSAGMLVERFNSGGTLDSSFGSGGVVHMVPGAKANAVALGPGGTIVVAGQITGSDSFLRVALVRLTSNGVPDPTFGNGGLDVVDAGEDSVGKAVVVQGDGRVLVDGSTGPGTHQGIAGFIARVNSNGSFDTSFGNGGAEFFSPQAGGASEVLNALTLDPAGGIVIGGGSTTGNQSVAVFARLTCSGAADPSFAGSGLEVQPSSATFVTDPIGANGVAVVAGRRIVGVGAFRDSGLTSAANWGFEPGGALDFANHSTISGAQANAVAVGTAQGNLVVAGANVPAGLAPSGFVARYLGFGGPATGSTPCGGVGPTPTPAAAPTVVTGSASGVSTNAASVSGSVNPNGSATSYYFQYGTGTSYGAQTATVSAGAGSSAVGVSAALSGLLSGTTYHYRLVATNTGGTVYGADATFRTAGGPPPAPVVSKFAQSNSTWGEAKSKTLKRPVGTTFSFTLNVNASVSLTFTQKRSGRRVNGLCVAQNSKNRGKPSCKRTVTLGTLFVNGHAGSNKVSFKGSISRHNKLTPGTYTVTITAINPVGKNSKPQSLTFTITR